MSRLEAVGGLCWDNMGGIWGCGCAGTICCGRFGCGGAERIEKMKFDRRRKKGGLVGIFLCVFQWRNGREVLGEEQLCIIQISGE